MQKLLPLLLLLITLSIQAQDYKLFPSPNDTLAFKGTAGNVLFMSFDSVDAQTSQTIYWPHRELHFSGHHFTNGCFAQRVDTSWFGYKIIHEHNSNEYVFECDKLVFTLKPSLNSYSGDSIGWMNYDGDTVKLVATTIGKFQKTLFNNQVDSVIQTEIKFVGRSGNIRFSYPDSSISIEVSKTYGIQAFPFLQEWPMYYSQVISKNRNHERISYKLLSRKEVFDFQIGDEFHYYGQYRNLMNSTSSNHIYINHKVIGVQFPKIDSVVYTIFQKNLTYKIDPFNMTVTRVITEDTIQKSYGKLNKQMDDNLSFEASFSTPIKTSFWLTDTLGHPGLHIIENFFVDTGSFCLQQFLEPYHSTYTYIKGLGLIWEEAYYFPGYNFYKLIYAHKATGQIYGKPYHIKLSEVAPENQLKIYPNPTTNYLNVKLPDEIQSMKIVVIDQLGRKLIEQSVKHENQTISVEDLTPGTYFIKTDSGKAIPFVKQ